MFKKTLFRTVMIGLLLAQIASCSKKSEDTAEEPTLPATTVVLPVLTTTVPTAVTTTTITTGGKVESKGNVSISSRGICYSTTPNPTIANQKVGTTAVLGTGEFTSLVKDLTANTTYYIKAYAETSGGVVYGNELTVKTIDIVIPELRTDSTIIIGKDIARFGGTIIKDGGSAITARGVCYSTSPNPTTDNDKVLYTINDPNFICIMEGLTPNTTYYVRSFATNVNGTAYGNMITFKTIVGGNVTYTLQKKATPTADEAEAYSLITAAMNTAVSYYNRYTNVTKVLTVQYEPSVATADGSISGNIRFGTGRVYMNPGTCQHEIAHTIGVGQSTVWNNLIVNGIYTGKNANAVHQWITKDPTATILEDGAGHFKPYQFNVPNAPQTTLDYIYHALVMEGMRKDGLPIN